MSTIAAEEQGDGVGKGLDGVVRDEQNPCWLYYIDEVRAKKLDPPSLREVDVHNR